jgi:EF hand
MKYAIRLPLALAALAMAFGTVVAAPFGRGPVPFAAIDANSDGVVSAQELDHHRAERQAARLAQGRQLRHAAQAPRFQAWDTNADGYLTPTELYTGQRARFAARGAGRPCPWYRW